MIQFKLKGQTYTIEDPTIADYYKIQDYLLLLDQVSSRIRVVHLLSGVLEEDLRAIPSSHFDTLWLQILEGPLDMSVSDKEFIKNFVIDDKFYHFIDMNELTIGEAADMDTLRAHPQKDKQLHKMMAILYRPATMITDNWSKVDEYTMEGFDARADLFLEKMPIRTVLGAINFFFHITHYSYESMMDFLVGQMTTPEDKKTLLMAKDSMLGLLEGGLNSSTLSLETMRSELKDLLVSLSPMLSTSSPTEKTKRKRKRWSMRNFLNSIVDKA